MRWWYWALIAAAAAASFAAGYVVGFARAPDFMPGQWCPNDAQFWGCFREWLSALAVAAAPAVALLTLWVLWNQHRLAVRQHRTALIKELNDRLTRIRADRDVLFDDLYAMGDAVAFRNRGRVTEVFHRFTNRDALVSARQFIRYDTSKMLRDFQIDFEDHAVNVAEGAFIDWMKRQLAALINAIGEDSRTAEKGWHEAYERLIGRTLPKPWRDDVHTTTSPDASIDAAS